MNSSDKNTAGIAIMISFASLIWAIAVQRDQTSTAESAALGADQPAAIQEDHSLSVDKPAKVPAPEWNSLFDGKTLDGWKKTEFGGEGEVEVVDGRIVLNMGYMTGVTSTREDLPLTNYEIELKAVRLDGNDFFCGLTFPVKASHCSLILGGWGGSVHGLSSIDGMDASENDTTDYRLFEKGEWYHVRVRVLDDRIQAWLDNERIVDQDIVDKDVGIRAEMELSCPLGIATYSTTGGAKEIRIRKLSKEELELQ
jgi:hypothetical protein